MARSRKAPTVVPTFQGDIEWMARQPFMRCLLIHPPSIWRRNASFRIAAVIAAAIAPWSAATRAAAPPAELVEALKRNADALSPLTVKWVQQLGSDATLEEWLRKVKYEAYNVDEFTPVDVVYAWQDGMSYFQEKKLTTDISSAITIGDDGRAHARTDVVFTDLPRELSDREAACNLSKSFRGQHREYGLAHDGAAATLSIDRVDDPKYFGRENKFFNTTYFEQAGFAIPRAISELRNGAPSLPLYLLDHGADFTGIYEASTAGVDCVVIELQDQNLRKRFFLDASRAHAVLRREELSESGQLTAVAEMRDFVKFSDPDLWLPKHCDVAYHTWWTIPDVVTDEPLATLKIDVSDINKEKIPLDRFTLAYTTPGTHVADATLPQAEDTPDEVVNYTVPANPRDLDAAIDAAAKDRPFVPSALGGASRWFVIVNIIILALVIAAVGYQYLRASPKS